jgi:hypothetical protein
MVLMGNVLEETAYHEAGHIVIASVVGLPLTPSGITVYEADEVTEGYARYCEDERRWENILMALRAGVRAQLKKFPQSWIGGSQPDTLKFGEIIKSHFEDRCREMDDKITPQLDQLLESHWSAVVAVAQALMESCWIPVEPSEHRIATRKKELNGTTLVAILGRLGISAEIRGERLP